MPSKFVRSAAAACAFVVSLSGIAFAQAPPIIGSAPVRIVPSSATPLINDSISVDVDVDVSAATGVVQGSSVPAALSAFRIPLTFDNTRLQLVSVAAGQNPAFAAAPLDATDVAVANGNGRLTVTAVTTAATPPAGIVSVATLRFNATAGGTAPIAAAAGVSLASAIEVSQATLYGPASIPPSLVGGGVVVQTPAALRLTANVVPSPVASGGTCAIVLAAENSGGSIANGVVVSGTIPSGLTIATLPAGVTQSGATLTWSAGSLFAGATVTAFIGATTLAPPGTTFDAPFTATAPNVATPAAATAHVVVANTSGLLPGSILAAPSISGSGQIFDITSGTAQLYATLPGGSYVGPILITPQGRVLVATNANGGSIYDISAGGDLRGSTPFAQNLFGPALAWLEGLAIDSAGNLYVSNAEVAGQRIAKIGSDGSVSYLPPSLDYPSGLLVNGGALLVSEGASGTIKRIDLSTFAVTTFASGFTPANDHFSGQLGRDLRGKIFVLWANAANGNGLFDVSAGGDFSIAAPLTAHNAFRVDVNQFGFDLSNNVWFAGDGSGWAWRAPFSGGAFGAATQSVGGLSDTESLAIYPPPSGPSLAATLSAAPSPVGAGSTLVYTVAYQNNGGANATNVVITDDVPGGTTFAAATGGGTLSGSTVTWTLPSLATLTSGSVSVTVNVTAAAGSNITNAGASIRADGLAARSSAAVVTPVAPPATLALNVVAPTTTATGSFITYRVTCTNNGGVAANNVVVTDPLPAGTAFSFASDGGALAGGIVQWSFPTIAAGATQTFSLVVQVNAGAGSTVTNSGSSASASNAAATAGNSVTTSIAAAAALTITQAGAPNPTTTGGRINFAITTTNTAATTATNVVLIARVPRGGNFLQATGGGAIANGVVTWSLGSLAAGTSTTVRLSVLAAVAAGGFVVSDDVSATADTSTRASAAAVTIAVKATPAGYGPGTILSDDSNGSGTIWDLTTGTRQTFGIVPAYAGPVAFSADGHAYIACAVSNAAIYDITPGGDLRGAQPFVSGIFSTNGFLDGMTIDTAGNFYVTNSEIDNQRIARITPAGEVSFIGPVTHYASALLAIDSTLYYAEGGTGTVKALDLNSGNVTVFASGFGSGSDHYSGQLARDPRGHLFTFWRNSVGNGLYDITGGGDFSTTPSLTGQNAFRIDVNQTAFDLNNNFYVAGNGSSNAWRALFNPSSGTFGPTNIFVSGLGDNETMGIFPAYNLTVAAAAAPTSVSQGQTITFTIQYQSHSITSVTNASISATVPTGSHLLSVSNGGVVAGSSVIWQLGTLAAQATGSVTMTVVADYAAGGTITLNNYSIVADQRPASGGPPVSVNVVAPTTAPLGITLSASASTIVQGGTIVYTLKFDNENGVAANNVVVRDPLPAGATFLAASNGGSVQNGVVVWSLGTLAAGGSGSVSFSVRADSGPITNANTTISATGLADGSGPAVTTQVIAMPVILQVSAAGAPSPVVSGQTLTYSVHGSNAGTSTATSATIDLAVPSGLAFSSANGGGTLASGRVTWPLGALAPGTSIDVAASFTVTAAGGTSVVLSDYGIASAQSVRVAGAPVTTNVLAPAPPPPLGVVLTAAPAQVAMGDLIAYQIAVTNVDSAAATGVVVLDAIPAGTSLISTTGPATATDTSVQWSLGTLGAGESVALGMTVRATAVAPATIVNGGATASADARAAASSNAVQTSVAAPPATLHLGLSGPSSVTPNGTITYTLTYANDGPAAAANATLTDPLPPGTAFVAASGATIANGVITWPIGALAAGASGSVTLVVSATAAPGSSISNGGSQLAATGADSVAGPTVLTDVVYTPALFGSTLATDKTSYTVPDIVHQSASFTYGSGGSGVVANLTASLTTTNASGAVVAASSQPIASLNVGTTVPVAYDWPTTAASSGNYTVAFNVVDGAGNALAQRSVTISVAAPDAAHLSGTLAPVNSPVPLGTALQVHVTISNQNGIAYSALPLQVAIVDPATLAIRKSTAFTLAVGANAGAATDVTLPTAGLNIQPYALWLTTSVGTGHLLATSSATITAPLLTLTPASVTLVAGASGSLTATLGSAPAAPVTLSIASANPAIVSAPSTATIAAGATSTSIPLQALSVGGPVTIMATLPPSLGGAGATSRVTVIMTGALTATLQVFQGENVTFSVTINNGGQNALNGAPFAIEIHDPSSGNLIDSIPFTATIAAGAAYTTTIHYATTSLAFQKYDARLVYAGTTPPSVIATATFEVLKPQPLRLAAAVGGPARVLIWSSCSPGNSGKPCTPVPPPFLTKTLRDAGIPYLVVGDELTFLAAMRTGGFSCAVIDQANPAEPAIAPEYLVDVHAGFGLLFIHSAPNAMPKLAPALQTNFLGVLHGPATLTLAATPFSNAGTLTLNGNGVVITLDGARAAATTPAGDPAISYATYGRGNVVTIPFDLEQTATGNVASLILSAVSWISRPLPASFTARDVVPLSFAVTTPPGGAVPVSVTVTPPAGAGVVDALPPLTTTSPLSWSATLDGNTTTSFVLWVRLPDATGDVTISVDVGLTGGPPVVTKTLTLSVSAGATSIAAQLGSDLAALKNAATMQKDAKSIDDAIAQLAAVTPSGDPLANLQHLLAIVADLDSLSIDAAAARADADRLVVYWQSRVGA